MRLRYEQQIEDQCLLLLEIEPQVRSIITPGNQPFRRVPFPYILATICYTKMGKDSYYYGGIYRGGLRIFLRNEKLTSLDDPVFYSPTDLERAGLVCTDHHYDNRSYKSPADLCKAVLTLWWNSYHMVSGVEEWSRQTLAEALARNWASAGTYRQAVAHATPGRYFGSGYTRYNNDVLKGGSFVDLPFETLQS